MNKNFSSNKTLRLLGITGVFALLLISINSMGQKTPKVDWQKMGENKNVSFYDVQKAFYKKWNRRKVARLLAEARENEGKKEKKNAKKEREEEGYEVFKRWEEFMVPRVYPSGDMSLPYTSYENFIEWQKTKKTGLASRESRTQTTGNWTALGPLTRATGYDAGMGRVDFIRFNPTTNSQSNKTMYVGSPDGGLWRSFNGGTNWVTSNTDFLPVIGVADFAINPADTLIMYIATGSWEGDKASRGIYKSTNGGASWVATSLVFPLSDLQNIRKLEMDPSDPSIMIATTKTGVYRTTNGWTSFTQVITTGDYYDVKFKPGSPATVYVSGVLSDGSLFQVSADHGATWTSSATDLPSSDVSRVILGVTPALGSADVVYALIGNAVGGYKGLYKSINAGSTFSLQSTQSISPLKPNILNSEKDGNPVGENNDGGQATHDMAIAVSPTDADVITVGGISQWRSTNGGVDWTIYTFWFGRDPAYPTRGDAVAPYVHADVQSITYLPGSSSTIFTTCDGGISQTTDDGLTWTYISNNIVVSQETGIGSSASDPTLYLVGLQDIGTLKSGSPFTYIGGGDGEDAFIDRRSDNTFIVSDPNGQHRLSKDGGANFTDIPKGDLPQLPAGNLFFSPISQDPANPDLVYVGGREKLYKSTGVLSDATATWSATLTDPPSGNFTNVYFKSIVRFAVAPSNSQIIYVIKAKSLSKTTDAGATWTLINGTLPINSADMTNLTVSNTDPDKVWVTFSGFSDGNKVFKTTDGGTTWTSVSTGLPNIPFNTIVYTNNSPIDAVYIGGDIGVYYMDNTMTSWAPYMTALPNTRVTDLEIYYPTSKLRASTYGRGAWESNLFTGTNYYPIVSAPDVPATNLAALNNWTPNADGSAGTAPANFSSTDQTFVINRNAGVTGAWTLAGSSAVITSGAVLTFQPGARLEISSASSTVNFAGYSVVLKSDPTNTASIGNILGTLSGATNVTVERYIPSKRSYRLLAPSVNTSTFIKANWQEGANNTDLTNNYNPSPTFGTHITGSTTGANGFDATQTGGASLYTYNYGSPDTYVPIANTNATVLDAKAGYLLFLRGDRNLNNITTNTGTTTTTLRATGTLVVGDVSYTLQPADKFTLVTNPYASPINWASILGDNTTVKNSYTYLDPRINTRGGYVTVTGGMPTPSAGIFATNDIQSGQAFFVNTITGATGTNNLVIKEAHKSIDSDNQVFRTGNQEHLSISLFFNSGGSRLLADGVNEIFNNNYSALVDNNDVEQIGNFDEDIAIKREGKMLVVEGRPLIDNNDTIFLSQARMKVQAYEFEFNPGSFNAPGLQAVLQDNFLNNETPVDLSTKTVITFNVTSDPASSAAGRFRIVFRNITVLPINFTKVKAFEKGRDIQVEWNMGNEAGLSKYEVEKSIDGSLFTKAGTQAVRAIANTNIDYSWLDANANLGNNFYRIKAIERGGQFKYSQVVNVNIGKGQSAIGVYPNPVKSNVVSLQFTNMLAGKYSVQLFSNLGQEIYRSEFNHSGGSSSQTLELNTTLAKGIYQLKVTSGKTIRSQKVVFE